MRALGFELSDVNKGSVIQIRDSNMSSDLAGCFGLRARLA